jgi:hypothetical protein
VRAAFVKAGEPTVGPAPHDEIFAQQPESNRRAIGLDAGGAGGGQPKMVAQHPAHRCVAFDAAH